MWSSLSDKFQELLNKILLTADIHHIQVSDPCPLKQTLMAKHQYMDDAIQKTIASTPSKEDRIKYEKLNRTLFFLIILFCGTFLFTNLVIVIGAQSKFLTLALNLARDGLLPLLLFTFAFHIRSFRGFSYRLVRMVCFFYPVYFVLVNVKLLFFNPCS